MAHLSIMTDEGVSQDVFTDAAGRFRSPALPGAAHRVWVEWWDAKGKRKTAIRKGVRPEDGDLEIRLASTR